MLSLLEHFSCNFEDNFISFPKTSLARNIVYILQLIACILTLFCPQTSIEYLRQEVKYMAQGQNTNQLVVPQARQALDQLKQETAAELGIQNYQGYLGDVPSKLNGAVGGNMVKKMIQSYEQQFANQQQ